MIIFYKVDTKEIIRTEDNTMIPVLPANMTFDEKKEYYATKNENFIALPYEMGFYVFSFKLSFDVNGNYRITA